MLKIEFITLQHGYAHKGPIACPFFQAATQICHAIAWMSSLSWFLAYKKKELWLFEWGVRGGKEWGFFWLQKGRPFGWKHLKANLSGGKLILSLEEEENRDLNRRNGFHLHSSSIFMLFLIFYDCISPLYELISFSMVFI